MPNKSVFRVLGLAVILVLAFVTAAHAQGRASTAGSPGKGRPVAPDVVAAVTPIAPGPTTTLPEFVRYPMRPLPFPPARVPQNPSLAPNSFSGIHNDTWASDVYDIAGPLGRDPEVRTSTMTEARRDPNSPQFFCPGLGADSHGRLVLSCTGKGEWSLVLVDPDSLAVLAYTYLPINASVAKAASASYIFIDSDDRVVVPIVDNDDGNKAKIRVYETVGSPGDLSFRVSDEYDISSVVGEDDNVNGVLADWRGRIWFVIRESGTVGVFDPKSQPLTIQTVQLEGSIANNIAIDHDAAYIVTTKNLYRIEAGPDGIPHKVWEASYQNDGIQRPGTLSTGSGTTPTILGKGKYVAITDNVDQLHIVVYRTDAQLKPEDRQVCEAPVFKAGHGADENSLIGAGLTLIAYSGYGYDFETVFRTMQTMPDGPGIARVDIEPDGKGCKLIWENDDLAVIDATAKMSTKAGVMYAVTREYDVNDLDVYYFTAVDVSTGEVAWKHQIGTGINYDSFSALMVGPNGSAYMPQYGGLVAVRDMPSCPVRRPSIGLRGNHVHCERARKDAGDIRTND